MRLFGMEGFPSGQREQTVNLSAKPSEVRILPPPFYRGIPDPAERWGFYLQVPHSSGANRINNPSVGWGTSADGSHVGQKPQTFDDSIRAPLNS